MQLALQSQSGFLARLYILSTKKKTGWQVSNFVLI